MIKPKYILSSCWIEGAENGDSYRELIVSVVFGGLEQCLPK